MDMRVYGKGRSGLAAFIALLAAGLLCFSPCHGADSPGKKPGLKVYITRHAETMGNATGNYSEVNQRTFSPKGLKQVEGITEKLKDYHFDKIFVSPTFRTQQTILPYLKAHNITGEIWPEIEEQCFDITASTAPAARISEGDIITIFDSSHLKFRDESSRRSYKPHNASEALAQFMKARELIKKEYSCSGKSILLVGHYCTGNRLMEILLGLEPKGVFGPENCAVSLLEETEDGSFRMALYNDRPFTQQFYWGRGKLLDGAVILDLFPRPFLNDIGKKYTVRWKIYDEKNSLSMQEESSFIPKNRTNAALLSVKVPADKFKAGSRCRIEADIIPDGGSAYGAKEDFIIPTYTDLEGAWLISKGDDASWSSEGLDDSAWKQIDVPGVWENSFIGEYDGSAWYRIHFKVSEEDLKKWDGKYIAFVMGAVDDADETFLNGVKIGGRGEFPPVKKTAWDKQRVYPVDKSLLKPNNVLSVRISDWGGTGGIWRGPVAIGPVEELNVMLKK